MRISSTRSRAVRAFLLGPLIGSVVGLLFLILFVRWNTLVIIFTMEAVLVVAYAGAWIIGLPLYLLMVGLDHMRPVGFVYAFTGGGLLIWVLLFWRHHEYKGAVAFSSCARSPALQLARPS